MMRLKGGARGMLWCSQIASGNANRLRLRVYGTRGGLEWAQEDPNNLWFTPLSRSGFRRAVVLALRQGDRWMA